MWARVIEILLGCWLILSPFIFGHADDQRFLWLNDILSGILTVALAALSFSRRFHYAHLAICAVAIWLIGFGYLAAPHPPPPALQNNVLLGWLLVMFAIIPNDAFLPPRPWRDFLSKETRAKTVVREKQMR